MPETLSGVMPALGRQRRLRVVMPIFFYFPVIMGGAEQQARRLAGELASRGHRVTIVTGWWNRSTPQMEEDGDVLVQRHSTLWECLERWTLSRMIRHYAYELSLGWMLWSRRREYDVIHAHQALHAAMVATVVGRLAGKPVVVKVGCGGEFGDLRLMKGCQVSPLGKMFWRIIKRCDAIVAISRQIKDELLDDGFTPGKVLAIPNGISVQNIAPKAGYALTSPPRLLSVGRLEAQKGFDVLLAALSMPQEGAPVCNIFGEGKERGPLSSLIAACGLAERVSLPGVAHDIPSQLAQADLFVLPSRAEGMSNALMEAMAAGLPCIATHVGGNNDLLDPESQAPPHIVAGSFHLCANGILVAPDDPAGFKNALDFLLRDEEVRRRIGTAARCWIAGNVLLETVADRYLGLYCSLLHANPGKGVP